MHWLYYLVLIAVMAFGWFVNIIGLPGLWLMVGAYAFYGLFTGWNRHVGWASLIAMVLLAVAAEIVEFAAGAAGSSAAGGRKRGALGAIVGGLIGGIFLTALVPIPIVGTIVGACIGAFLGAAIMEFWDKDAAHSLRVGYGAAKGRFWGIISKSAFGLVMMLVALVAALPYGAPAPGALLPPAATTAASGPPPASAPPVIVPATVPATTPSSTLPSLP
jgi:uncharacterized protein YqgC (DUF456 family)